MMMKKISMTTLALSLLMPYLALAHCGKAMCMMHRPQKPLLISGFSNPESVVADSSGKRLFVSNLGTKLDPSSKDKDGFISAITPDGKILNRRYFPSSGASLNAPKGMVIVGNTLYVADIDRVVGFDLNSRKQVYSVDLSKTGTKFLNDLTVKNDKTLFASTTDTGKVYAVTLGDHPAYAEVADLPGANGLYYDQASHKLYAVSFGEGMNFKGSFGVISLHGKKGTYKILGDQKGGYDGLFVKDGKMYFSDWVGMGKPGVIRIYDLKKKELSPMPLQGRVKGPADIFYDTETGRLWIPAMVDQQVLSVNLVY